MHMQCDTHILIAIPVGGDTYDIMCDIWCTHIDSYFCWILWNMMPTYQLLFLWHMIHIISCVTYDAHISNPISVAYYVIWCPHIGCYSCGIRYSLHMINPIAFAVSQYDDGICKGNVLQCAAVCCSVLQCAAVRMSTYSCGIWQSLLHLQCHNMTTAYAKGMCCSALQYAAVCCSVLQWECLPIPVAYDIAYCICSVIFSVSNPYRWSRSQGLFDHVSL